MNTSEILNRAADLIGQRGWTSGIQGWGDHENVCLEGAILVAAEIRSEMESDAANLCPAGQAVRDYLVMGPYNQESPLYDWNDASGRTAAEVIEVLRAAAVIEEARENTPRGVFRMSDITAHIPAEATR